MIVVAVLRVLMVVCFRFSAGDPCIGGLNCLPSCWQTFMSNTASCAVSAASGPLCIALAYLRFALDGSEFSVLLKVLHSLNLRSPLGILP